VSTCIIETYIPTTAIAGVPERKHYEHRPSAPRLARGFVYPGCFRMRWIQTHGKFALPKVVKFLQIGL